MVTKWGQRGQFNKVFFESGSTLCPLLGKIAEEYLLSKGTNNPRKMEKVLTNNLFALTSLVNLVKEVTPVEGQFVTSYFGFFPFMEKDDAPVNDENAGKQNKQLWQTEADGYSRLKKGVSESDLVVTTCSNFSFLAGPLVGRRANAIAKHAMYVGKQPNHEFLILLDFQKIIPFTDTVMEMSEPGENCYCVLPQPKNVDVQMGAATMDGWHRKWVDEDVKKETSEFANGIFNDNFVDLRYLQKSLSRPDFSKPWRDLAAGTRIIVSLPDKREQRKKEYIPTREESFDWICNEVQKCEEKIGQRLRFDISDRRVADEYGVVDIEVMD